jgi:parallel beta-helix repeat protein
MRKSVALSILLLLILVAGLLINSYFSASHSSSHSASKTSADVQSPTATNPSSNYVPPSSPPPGSIIVPDDFPTISQAVANASDGQAIFVRSGQYNESVKVDKSVWLIGENKTVIDAHSLGPDLLICHDNVNVTGFTLKNTPTPATGSWIEQMQGIGLSTQLPDIQIVNSSLCNIYANNLTDGSSGVYLENCSQINIVKNYLANDGSGCISGGFFSTDGNGADIDSSTNNYIANNVFTGCGIKVESFSDSNNIINNTINGAGNAISLDSSSGNVLRNNTLVHNFYNFEINGSQISDFINYVDSSNTVDGKPICYLIGESNEIVPSDAACVVLVNCANMTVRNPVVSLSSYGVVLVNTTGSTVNGCKLGYVDPAYLAEYSTSVPPSNILLYGSSNNQITDNQATIWLDYSDNNILTQNKAVLNLYGSNNNEITANLLESTGYDAIDWFGVCLQDSSNNIVSENTISGIGGGVSIISASSNNTIMSNNIVDNTGGIIISDFEGDLIGSSSLYDPNRPSFNVLYCNNIADNANEGILDCGYCTEIIGNVLTGNSNCGIDLSNSQNCTIIENSIDGIYIGVMGNNTINTLVVANNITVNRPIDKYSTWLVSAYPVTFYLNNFLGPVNCSHYGDDYCNSTSSNGVNYVWDNGSQGNYWSGYNGTSTNGNGIGDTPYSIGFGYYDNYPLMTPYNIAEAIPPTPLNLPA